MRSKKFRTARIAMAGLVIAGAGAAGFAGVAAARTEQAAAPQETAKAAQGTVSRAAAGPEAVAAKSKFVFQNERPAAVPGRTDVKAQGGWDALHSSLGVARAAGGPKLSAAFPTAKVHTVIFTSGTKAWYADVEHRDGWTKAAAQLKGVPYAGEPEGPTNPARFGFAVFAYDQTGRLLHQFPGKIADPLGKGAGETPPGFSVYTTAG
ncbi:hypothetical protein [Kribbella sp. DT2]|uniref:hypothetical protein n=1 Tax=Kribbella sp. DT2 TaxID=3393427 RepID=UPI003CEA0B02